MSDLYGWFLIGGIIVATWFAWHRRERYVVASDDVVREWARMFGMSESSTRSEVAAFVASVQPKRAATHAEILAAASKVAPPFSRVSIREGVPFGMVYIDVVTWWPMVVRRLRRYRMIVRIEAAVEATGLPMGVRVTAAVKPAWRAHG